MQISGVYIDHAHNADTERPAFEKMLADARNGKFEFIMRAAYKAGFKDGMALMKEVQK